jgi:plastocyanin
MNSLALFLLGASSLAAGSAAVDPQPKSDETGSIAGTVTWEGERPAPRPPLVMGEKESVGCKHEAMDKTDETLLISEAGGIANVVLTVEVQGVAPKVPAEPILLDQEGCRFHPHVQVVPVGATLRFDNSDETNHNIHTFAKKNPAVNQNVAGGTNFDQKLDKAEVIDIKCDVHPWMKGYVVVTDAAAWAVSGKDGSFKIEGLPPGEYKVSWWHEDLGKGKSEKVTVTGGASADLALKLGAQAEDKGGRRKR